MPEKKNKSREELRQGYMNMSHNPTEKDKEGISVMSEMHEMLKLVNPNVAVPFSLISTLAVHSSDYLHMEYLAREEDKKSQVKKKDSLSMMTDEELASLEDALLTVSMIMVKITKVLGERASKEDKNLQA